MNPELEQALKHVQSVLESGRTLHRQDVRPLLIAFGGELHLINGAEPPETWVQRIQGLLGSEEKRENWNQAVESELALACAEHIHAVDPRYLELPNYDFAYTLQARERLADRLRAARALGIEPSEALLEQVEAADRRLEPFRRKIEEPQERSREPEA